jgi:hypothetical protein
MSNFQWKDACPAGLDIALAVLLSFENSPTRTGKDRQLGDLLGLEFLDCGSTLQSALGRHLCSLNGFRNRSAILSNMNGREALVAELWQRLLMDTLSVLLLRPIAPFGRGDLVFLERRDFNIGSFLIFLSLVGEQIEALQLAAGRWCAYGVLVLHDRDHGVEVEHARSCRHLIAEIAQMLSHDGSSWRHQITDRGSAKGARLCAKQLADDATVTCRSRKSSPRNLAIGYSSAPK